MKQKKFIIITSIFNPTKAIIEYAKKKDFKLVVVGDKKTPIHWEYENAIYLSPTSQEMLGYKIIKNLPYNHYCRKMVGYIYAINNGADMIIDTDDDNIPLPNWHFPKWINNYNQTKENLGFINIYRHFSNLKIWPRGFPIELINEKKSNINYNQILKNKINVGIWQGLVNGDPDVDAIYRLIINKPCIFKPKEPIVLNKGTYSPFNSQNTAFKKELFPLLYLPAFVTFRFTDILRSLVAQPIMWQKGFYLGFISGTVIQERNYHAFLKDFEMEIPMYLNSMKIINAINKISENENEISDNLIYAYNILNQNKIVSKSEIKLLLNWLKDINY
jgi:hypothetical protein